MALGAAPADLVRQAIADALRTTAVGLAAGVVASYLMSKWISGFLFGVSPTDAATFAIVPVFLSAVSVAACYIPARRAATIDPVKALRFE
jgi:putative ABC transport system permease protein